jgi:mannose-6-phosphate isomerase-like protein (cupin superfamily)
MTNATIKNLKSEIDDSAPTFGMDPAVEAHFARNDIGAEKFGLSYQRLAPNARMPFGHRHSEQEEVYVIVGGSGRVKIDDDVHEVSRWDAVRVGPGAMRNFEAGADGLELIAFGAPNTDGKDVEMVQGWWAEEG